jgi:hypothetical protein
LLRAGQTHGPAGRAHLSSATETLELAKSKKVLVELACAMPNSNTSGNAERGKTHSFV